MTKSANNTLGGKLNNGLEETVHSDVYTLFLQQQKYCHSKKAGTAAQAAMLGPVAALQKKHLV